MLKNWQWEPAASRAETLVTVEFHDLGKSTEVVLTRERFTSEEEKEKHIMAGTAASIS